MRELTKIEKEEIAFLIRQEINEGEKIIKELEEEIKTKVDNENKMKDIEIYLEVFEGNRIRKQKLKTIARKLEIEL